MTATVLSPPPARVHYEVVHHLPGRVRLRIPRLQYDDRYGRQLQALFVQEDSVQQIRLNLPAASLIVQYSPDADNPLHRFGQLIQAAADERLPLPGMLPIDKLVYSPWNTAYFIEKMALPTLALAIVALLPVQTPSTLPLSPL